MKRKSSILESFAKERGIHSSFHRLSSFRVPDDIIQGLEKFVCALHGNQWPSSVNEMCYVCSEL